MPDKKHAHTPHKGKGKGRKGVKRSEYQTKFKARGKGKCGKKRGNPFGRDGKKMLCTLCSSQNHFQKECPENPDN